MKSYIFSFLCVLILTVSWAEEALADPEKQEIPSALAKFLLIPGGTKLLPANAEQWLPPDISEHDLMYIVIGVQAARMEATKEKWAAQNRMLEEEQKLNDSCMEQVKRLRDERDAARAEAEFNFGRWFLDPSRGNPRR